MLNFILTPLFEIKTFKKQFPNLEKNFRKYENFIYEKTIVSIEKINDRDDPGEYKICFDKILLIINII